MHEHDTAHRHGEERHDEKGCEEPLMANNITVTVTPKNPKANKEVPCDIQIAPKKNDCDGVIWLSPNEDYNVMFNLPAAAPRNWKQSNAFCNNKGSCPDAAANGTQYGFVVTPQGAKSINVFIPAQGSKSVQQYRMNFEDDYYCDPIIVVGDV